jgi:hypothetical protein
MSEAEVELLVDVVAATLDFENAQTDGPAQRKLQWQLGQNPRVQQARVLMSRM